MAHDLAARKTKHLDICLDPATYRVETGKTRLDDVHLVHRALPEVGWDEVDPRATFLGHPVAMPVFISSMTGGSDEGFRVNRDLATVASELGIAVGMGSIRILLERPELIEHFELKKLAPSVPVFANIGGVNLPQIDTSRLSDLLERLAVDAVAVHLNPAQELFQPEGDTDFRGVREAIARFVRRSPVPVIVKETGAGINPFEARALLADGVAAVDLAGTGGTNWMRVEAYRDTDDIRSAIVGEFDGWGTPTALALAVLGREQRGVWASGGMRTALDVARALAMGAEAVGMALPFVRALKDGGVEAAVAFGRRLMYGIRTTMVLTGCRQISELRRAAMWLDPRLAEEARAFARALEMAPPNGPSRDGNEHG